jgi:hypothetical protein
MGGDSTTVLAYCGDEGKSVGDDTIGGGLFTHAPRPSQAEIGKLKQDGKEKASD